MGIFDDLEIGKDFEDVPLEYRISTYQTKDLDSDLSLYRVSGAGILFKVNSSTGKQETLKHAPTLNQDIGIYCFDKCMVLHVRNGVVVSVTLDKEDAEYWDGKDAEWIDFISG